MFVDDPAISQGNPPGEAVCDLAIMGDHHDRRSGDVQILQQAENRLAVLRVEVPRWLVGEDDRRNPHQSTSDRDPLALATGELGRKGRPTLSQPDLLQRLEGTEAALIESGAGVEEPFGDVVVDRLVLGQEELRRGATRARLPIAYSQALAPRQWSSHRR